MNKLPLISIVIPCYNAEGYLQETIESAFAQTYKNIEIFVIDDGSQDNSVKVAHLYGTRITLIQQKNSGVSSARNTGILHAKGDFILFLDADDLLTPKALEQRIAIIQSDIKIGVVVGYYHEIDANSKLIPRYPRRRNYPKDNAFYTVLKQSLPPSGWLFRKEVFLKCGYFDPFLKGGEDWDMLIRTTSKFRLGYDPNPNVLYRQFPNMSSANGILMYIDSLRTLEKNSILAKNPFLYWFYTRISVFYASEFAIYRLFKNNSLIVFFKSWFYTCFKYPLFFLHSIIVFLLIPFHIIILKLNCPQRKTLEI